MIEIIKDGVLLKNRSLSELFIMIHNKLEYEVWYKAGRYGYYLVGGYVYGIPFGVGVRK